MNLQPIAVFFLNKYNFNIHPPNLEDNLLCKHAKRIDASIAKLRFFASTRIPINMRMLLRYDIFTVFCATHRVLVELYLQTKVGFEHTTTCLAF